MKTPVPSDFCPTMDTIKILMAWGVEEQNPCGDKLIDQEFIEKRSIILEFIDYWQNTAPPSTRKKANWQTTYRNYIKRIAWPNHLRDFENNRHKRSDGGSYGFNHIADITTDKPKTPVKLRYKLPERPSTPSGPTNALEALKLAKQSLGR
jgi:hypothetical protein